MNVKQVYSILNSVSEQMYGNAAISVVDLTGVVALGDKVMSSASDKDVFLNTLVDRIGRTIISQRAYSAAVNSLIDNAFSFGAILQKIYVAPVAPKHAEQYDFENGTGDLFVIEKPDVTQKLFQNRDVWSVQITIPDFQLQSAFVSAEAMAAFIDAVFLAMRNSMEVYLEGMAELCYANMIGERVVDTKLDGGATCIDLLAAYNSQAGTSLTAADALISSSFLKYASMMINLYVKRLGKMAKVYNSESCARFTPKDRLRVTVLADFASATASFLESDTYHKELVALPQYSEVMYWQGIGAGGSFADVSKINIKTASGYDVVQPYVIAILSDVEAMGLMYDNRRSKSFYNPSKEYTQFFEKADMGYYNDLSENAVVFTMGALTTPSKITLNTAGSTLEFDPDNSENAVLAFTNVPTGFTVSAVAIDGDAVEASGGTNWAYATGTLTVKAAAWGEYEDGNHTVTVTWSNGAVSSVTVKKKST